MNPLFADLPTSIFEAMSMAARDRGGKVLATTADAPHLLATVLVARGDFAARYPDAVRRVLRGLLDAGQGVLKDPAAGARLWASAGCVGVVPRNFPAQWLAMLREAGINTSGVHRVDEDVEGTEWFFHRADGSRVDHLHGGTGVLAPGMRLSPAEAGHLEQQLRAGGPQPRSFGAFRAAHPVEPGTRAGDYQLADTVASLSMGIGSLAAPYVARRLLDPVTPGVGRHGRTLLALGAAAAVLTTVGDVVRRRLRDGSLPQPQTVPTAVREVQDEHAVLLRHLQAERVRVEGARRLEVVDREAVERR